MKTTELMTNMKKSFNKFGLTVKKNSPEILVILGVVGTVSSVVMACVATTKVSTILEETKESIDIIHDCAADESLADQYTQEDAKKDLTIVYAKAGIKFLKLYGPSFVVGALSMTSILASHNILRQRNIALAAAYTTIDKGFKQYRNRVLERFGEEVDKELRYDIKAQKVENEVVGEDGKKKKVKETISVVGENAIDGYSTYARFYDDGCKGWEKDPEYNLMFLRINQQFANDTLVAKGHLFLNEVYDMLGIPRTKAGQVVGWVYNKDNPVGDNYVDFGIYNLHKEKSRDFVNGYEKVILLDFNVDGNILDLI